MKVFQSLTLSSMVLLLGLAATVLIPSIEWTLLFVDATPSSSTVDLNVCVAIDSSGSICSSKGNKACNSCNKWNNEGTQGCAAGGSENNKMCCGDYVTLTSFARDYVNGLPFDKSSFSVVQYGSDAIKLADTGSSALEATSAIGSSTYTGGNSNTQHAILKCIHMLDRTGVSNTGITNSFIILITGSSPTACQTNKDESITVGEKSCFGDKCEACSGNDLSRRIDNAQDAAEEAADLAAEAGMNLIPIIVKAKGTNLDRLKALARCPSETKLDGTCDVENYKRLNVKSVDGLNEILEEVILITNQNHIETTTKTDYNGTDNYTKNTRLLIFIGLVCLASFIFVQYHIGRDKKGILMNDLYFDFATDQHHCHDSVSHNNSSSNYTLLTNYEDDNGNNGNNPYHNKSGDISDATHMSHDIELKTVGEPVLPFGLSFGLLNEKFKKRTNH